MKFCGIKVSKATALSKTLVQDVEGRGGGGRLVEPG